MMKDPTFADDLFDLKLFSERLYKFIKVECQFVEGSLVVALSSRFGSGKTTFLQMWQKELKTLGSGPLVISLNAWESDYYGDTLFAIVSALIEQISDEESKKKMLLDAAKDFGWYTTAIGNQILQKLTGINPVAAGELAESKNSQRHNRGAIPEDVFSIYQNRKHAMDGLKSAVEDFVKSRPNKVLFLVDELDRCRPDYAISYLETIKHIFDIPGAVFILAADRQQLENSAKTAFGPNLDFEEYYRKFIHREITLPPISALGYEKLATAYVDHYLQQTGSRECFMELDQIHIGEIKGLVGALQLTPRQIQEVFRILGHIFATTTEQKGQLRGCFAYGSTAMAVFKVGRPKMYRLLGNQESDPMEMATFLLGLFKKSTAQKWFQLFNSGGGLKDENMPKAMATIGLSGKTVPAIPPRTSCCDFVFEDCENPIAKIYEKIEHVSQWS